MNEADIIKGARDILSTPEGWGKGRSRPTLTSYCVVGAISKSCGLMTYKEFEAVVDLLKPHVPGGISPSVYNDLESTTHEDILNLLDKTLAELGAL